MAIGAAEVMGFKLMRNFDRPYLARSISEFWSRWHISLSSWFRDYVYIPLGGNRVVRSRWYYNLFITFLISGLWHGANWTFVIWGALHGFYLIVSLMTVNLRASVARAVGLALRPALHNVVRILITFGLTTFAWIFFRANNLADAIHVISASLHRPVPHQVLPDILRAEGITKIEVAFDVLLIASLMWFEAQRGVISVAEKFRAQPAWVRWPAYYAVCMSIWFLGISGEAKAFIYFQF
ncbi:MAG: MBOAT family O-acyltransferase, partial [Gemmatimonadales bacterium]